MKRPRRRNKRVLLDSTLPSPCTGKCRLNRDSLVCDGCFRSQEEIRNWSILNREMKLGVFELIKVRRQDPVVVLSLPDLV